MHASIPKPLPNLPTKHNRLLNTPPQNPRKQSQTQSLESLIDIVMTPRADLLVVLILGPRIQRPLEVRTLDVGKTSVSTPFFELVAFDHGAACLREGLFEEGTVASDGGGGREGVVVGAVGEADFLKFYVATRFQITARGSAYR